MKITVVNRSKQTLVVKHLSIARSFFRRLKGLLGTTHLSQGEGLFIQPCNSVHSFFMCYPIDVLFLDSSSIVVKVVENMAAGRVAAARASSSVLELPAGTVASTKTEIGDQLHVVNGDIMKK
jgi:uncharacterized membrane protein (UPF0127 family)